MLLELKQSPLAAELKVANQEIVRLFEALATEGADFENAMRAWDHPEHPTEASIEAVLALPLTEREALARAVAADVSFDDSFDDSGFAFAFPALGAETREAGKLLLVSMYKKVFRGRGFSLPANPEVTRTTWEAAFREANPAIKVCPACLLADLEKRIERRAAVDADHYLPHSRYPALAVHGLNLVPTCQLCNRTAKRDKDPLDSDAGPQPLNQVWFPYMQAGIEKLVINFTPSAAILDRLVSLTGAPGAEPQAASFDALFQLTSRWSNRLGSIHERTVNQARRLVDPPWEEEAVGAYLRKSSETMKGELSNIPGEYLAGCYCAWLADSSAFPAFVAEVRRPRASYPQPPAEASDL
ncbi:MAG TPA: hypothetical protein VJU14_11740 [Solirubrobacterales bacterium]|nr:hypothetical protein [Solirubrobacterales bacterium]